MAAPAIGLLVLLWGFYLIRSYSRGRSVPRCWRCGARKVRRSRFKGFVDLMATIWGLSPFRCTGCLTRFYGLRLSRDPAERWF